jgi:hypothetical protein
MIKVDCLVAGVLLILSSVELVIDQTSVGDPDPDPHVFGPESEVQIRLWLRIFPFSHKCVERTEKMPAK